MKPKLTPSSITASLAVANPTATNMNLGNQRGMPSGMAMTLPISEISFFDRNPRKIHDPEEYDRLKESIREIGVQQPVHVTTPPGSNRYMLARGGNSRLLCLKELLDETGDKKYAKIPCIFVEYTSEEDMLIAHLIENEQRADMVFWDKACAYADMRDMFQASNGAPLGMRPLAQQFVTKGLTISYAKLSVYLFAADHLAALGNACHALSIAKATDLRNTSNDLQTSLKEAGKADDAALFESFWDEVLENWGNTHAGEADLDIASLTKNLHQSFEAFFDTEPNSQGSLKAEPVVIENVPASDSGNTPASTGHADTKRSASENAATSPAPFSGNAGRDDADGNVQSDSVARTPVNPAPETIISNAHPAPAMDDTPLKLAEPEPRTREQVLEDIYKSVKNLLACAKIDNLLVYDSKMPYGFMLDFPDFNKKGWNDNDELSANALINGRHPYAATVFIYLWNTSGEKSLWDAPQLLQRYNPFTSHPQTIIASIYQDEQSRSDMEMYGIGMTSYAENVTTLMFELVVANEVARKAYFDYLSHSAELEHLGGDNWDLYQERV